jgi:iron complex transport system ATP-binding protein
MVTLTLDRVSVRYGRHAAVTEVSLAARRGEVVALIGPNGSGKSTLLRAIAGLVRHQGAVRLPPDAAGRVGFMPQETGSGAALDVTQAVLLGRLRTLPLAVSRQEVEAAEALLARLGIDHLAARRLDRLSGGQRQLVYLAQALAGEPRVLLLDEPTSALDLRHALGMLALVRELTQRDGLITLVAIHDLNAAARVADHIAVLRDGRLAVAGRPRETLTPALIAAIYGVEAEVGEARDGAPCILPLRALADRAQPLPLAGGG